MKKYNDFLSEAVAPRSIYDADKPVDPATVKKRKLSPKQQDKVRNIKVVDPNVKVDDTVDSTVTTPVNNKNATDTASTTAINPADNKKVPPVNNSNVAVSHNKKTPPVDPSANKKVPPVNNSNVAVSPNKKAPPVNNSNVALSPNKKVPPVNNSNVAVNPNKKTPPTGTPTAPAPAPGTPSTTLAPFDDAVFNNLIKAYSDLFEETATTYLVTS